jgi:hypothetical protein
MLQVNGYFFKDGDFLDLGDSKINIEHPEDFKYVFEYILKSKKIMQCLNISKKRFEETKRLHKRSFLYAFEYIFHVYIFHQ